MTDARAVTPVSESRAAARWTSAGHRALVAYLGQRGHTIRELARKCSVATGTIGSLASGVLRFPSLQLALVLERLCAIDVHAWERP